jgi:hypothetical protein
VVQLDVCMSAAAGAAWQCQYFEGDFEAAYGTPIECDLLGYVDRGPSECRPGDRAVADVDFELYE